MDTPRTRIVLVVALVVALLGSGTAKAASAPQYPVPYTLAAAVTAQLLRPGSAPPGANDWSCQPSADHPDPIVLVHGLGANMTENWQTISPLLANHGYCVFALTYGVHPQAFPPLDQAGGVIPMEESAEQLSSFVDRVLAATGASEVDIVGHSEGSLMPNYYVKFLGGSAKVDDYVGITPLWNGTSFYGASQLEQQGDLNMWSRLFAEPFRAVVDAFCGSCRQFLTGSDFIAKMNEGGVADPGVTYTNLMTKTDGLVVPYTSGVMNAPNATNLVVQNQCGQDHTDHSTMAADPIVAADVLNALDRAHPVRVPCTLVLPFLGAPLFSGTF